MKGKYETTKDECEKMLDGRVCSYCGRKVKPKKTVDNAGNPTYWGMCFHGSKESGHIEWGVYESLYEAAVKLVLNGKYSYPKDYEKDFDYWYMDQVHRACSIVRDVDEARSTKEPRNDLEGLRKYHNLSLKVN